MEEVQKLRKPKDMNDKELDEAMGLIEMAEQLKERKVALAEVEADIVEAGGAGCLQCDSCRYKFSFYQNWRKHQCPLSIPTKPATSVFRVVSKEEEMRFKTAMESATVAMKYSVCMSSRVCVPGVFPLLYLPQGRWAASALSWLGSEVGCIVQQKDTLKELQEDGVVLQVHALTVETRAGGLLEISSSLLQPASSLASTEADLSGNEDSEDIFLTDSEDTEDEDEDEEEVALAEAWEEQGPGVPANDPNGGGGEGEDAGVANGGGEGEDAGERAEGGGDGGGGGGDSSDSSDSSSSEIC